MSADERLAFYNRFYEAFFREMDGRQLFQLSGDELNVLQDFLWASHDDVVSEWSRREMMARSPFPRIEQEKG